MRLSPLILEEFTDVQFQRYCDLLSAVGRLSELFSNSSSPYLSYRVAENVYCYALQAENLSRSDCAIDAKLGSAGVGLKTFLDRSGASYQKVAEFNAHRDIYRDLDPIRLAKKVGELRNERIRVAQNIYGTESSIYHLVTRREHEFLLFETNMDEFDILGLNTKTVKKVGNVVDFCDGLNEYKFNISKSTLYKRFITPPNALHLPIKIEKDPFSLLEQVFENHQGKVQRQYYPSIILPLYSERGGIHVPEKSGLNQWNATGRNRDEDEVYIRIPALIQKMFSSFFPSRGSEFFMNLPNGVQLKTKVCQGGDKALMSNPNKALGKWLLRDLLKVSSGELCQYSDLERIGVDSVVIRKVADFEFELDFRPLGSYEDFKSKFLAD